MYAFRMSVLHPQAPRCMRCPYIPPPHFQQHAHSTPSAIGVRVLQQLFLWMVIVVPILLLLVLLLLWVAPLHLRSFSGGAGL